MKAKPLDGVVVIDFTRIMAGPFCTQMMADLGARVIRIEGVDEATTDTTRLTPPIVNGLSQTFAALNRNKESLSINLASAEAPGIIRKLIERADVVIENFKPSTSRKYGLNWENVRAINARVVLCSISGYGRASSMADTPAYDLVIQAASGAMQLTGELGRPPIKMGVPVSDLTTGVSASIGILAALRKRDATGLGSYIDISMLDVALSLLSYMAPMYLSLGVMPQRVASGHPTIYPYNAFETTDGYIVVAPFTQHFWRNFCRTLGRPELIDDVRYTDFAGRMANREGLHEILSTIMKSKGRAEWLRILEEGDVPCALVHSVGEALDLPHTRARDMVSSMSDMPSMPVIGTPFRFAWSDGSRFEPTYRSPPAVGQQTEDILNWLQREVRPTPSAMASAQTPNAADDATPPISGLKVLDLTRMAAGPFCTQLLADLGADVIKIESDRSGDPTRGNIPKVDGYSTYFLSVNRGKRSVALDLKSPEGRQRVLDLARDADVIVENFRPGVMDRLGLSYAELKAVNPDIIFCSISGFGHTGPLRNKISFDLVTQSMAGYVDSTGEPGRPPSRIGIPIGDLAGSYAASFAILAALRHRDRSGLGAHIDLALHDVLVSQLAYLGQTYLTTGESPARIGSGHPNVVPYRAYATSNGHMVVAAYNQSLWQRLIDAIGMGHLAQDARYATRQARLEHRELVDQTLEKVFVARATEHWLPLLGKVGVPAAPVSSIGDALDSEVAKSRGVIIDVPLPNGYVSRAVASPFHINGRIVVSPKGPPGYNADPDATWATPLVEKAA